MNGNTVTVVANLTRDPEVKYLDSGMPYARFSVADNFSWPNKKTGERDEKVSFIDCIAWGDIAENIGESLSKGDRVIIVGRLDQKSWTTEDDEKRTKLEIDVDSIGPELRFATAQVSKTEKSNKGRSGGGSKRQSRREPEPQQYEDDEEPF